MKHVDAVDLLAAAGIYSSEDDVAYGKDVSDSRNERMVLKVVGHLGDSDHKYNLPALGQLAAAWPASRTAPIDLDTIGAFSYTEGGQLMANVSVLPFGGAQSSEVAYGAGINLISNMYTAERMEAFTRNLLYPTVVMIVEELATTERLWLTKQSTLAADTSLPEARRSIHSGHASRSRRKVSAMEALPLPSAYTDGASDGQVHGGDYDARGIEKIRRKIRPPGIKPAFLRRLGPYVTKEELESIYQKIESVTRIFEKMLFFSFFKKK